MRLAGEVAPGCCPAVLADDPTGAFAMAYLDPAAHRLWKSELLEGRVDALPAAGLGHRVGTIHRATAGRDDLRHQFDNPPLFAALRLDPYLSATARAHRDLAARLDAIRTSYLDHRCVVTHGDVSPKNVMVVSGGPLLLDAECANWGDPAFDVAFCTTHLHLKGVRDPASAERLLRSAEVFADAYRTHIDWEPPDDLESRVAATVPALLLARIDGLSPVEYLDDTAQDLVRRTARQLLADPPRSLDALRARWLEAVVAPTHDRAQRW
jgi:hypothetical protein